MLLTCRFSPNASQPRHCSPSYSNYIRDGAVIPLTVGGQVARRWVAHGEGKRAAAQEGVGAEVKVDHFSSLQVGDERVGCAFFFLLLACGGGELSPNWSVFGKRVKGRLYRNRGARIAVLQTSTTARNSIKSRVWASATTAYATFIGSR